MLSKSSISGRKNLKDQFLSFERIEQSCTLCTLQDGKFAYVERNATLRGLYLQD